MSQPEESTLEEVKRRRSNAKRKVTQKFNRFKNNIDNDILLVRKIYVELEEAFLELERINDEYISIITDEKLKDDADEYISEAEKIKDYAFLLLKNKEKNEFEANNNKSVKIKPLEAPVFSGNLREFPSFKKNYERLVKAEYGKDPYALQCCLQGEALLSIKGLEDDHDAMMNRLESRFGNKRKLADSIVHEIQTLKPVPENDCKKLISLIDVIHRCWRDLCKMDMKHEMESLTIITQIERLLPENIRREWVRSLSGRETENICFEEFMNFLLREKSAVEYLCHDIRADAPRSSRGHAYSLKIEEENLKEGIGIAINKIQTSIETLSQTMINLLSKTDNNPKIPLAPNINRWCWLHRRTDHDISECTTFEKSTVKEKIAYLKRSNACFCCLRTGHMSSNCRYRKPCGAKLKNGNICERFHHEKIHDEQEYIVNEVNLVNDSREQSNVHLMVSQVKCKDSTLNVLWDPGANMSLITHKSAKMLKLKSSPVNIWLSKVGNTIENIDTSEYIIPLTDRNGYTWDVRAYGINEITKNPKKLFNNNLAMLFKTIDVELVAPDGPIDILIGSDCCPLLPVLKETNGNLQLMENQFGFCVRGSHPSLASADNIVESYNVQISNTSPHIQINESFVQSRHTIKENLDEYFQTEALGTSCVPKCGSCKCGGCSLGKANYTIKEERELKLIQNCLEYHPESYEWYTSYPWIKNPRNLPNNYHAALAKLKSTEKRLLLGDLSLAQRYNEQISNMTERNVARKLSEKELREYNDVCHYIHHHEVINADSLSTPLRIVFNSSANYMGHVLNDYWAKGPDVLNNPFGILLRFRERKVAMIGDISKMFNSVKLKTFEQHVHRFLWRDLNLDLEPHHYILTAVPFGDRPSGIIAMEAMRMTAELSSQEYPTAVKLLTKNSYVDDLIYSVDDIETAHRVAKETEKLLLKGNFKIKSWVISHTEEKSDQNLHFSAHEKVLGLRWETKEDILSYKVKINFSPKRGKERSRPDLKVHELEECMPQNLTRRMILSQISSIYDPLGLIVPFTLKSKLLMRELITNNKTDNDNSVNWDAPVSDDWRRQWVSLFHETFALQELKFERCIKPCDVEGNPRLVVFCDGSNVAFGACVYIRWKTKCGLYYSSLLTAKNRLTPLHRMTIPRVELCGALLGCRLADTVHSEIGFDLEATIYIIDSTIVYSQIQKESYGFGTFVAVRIAEIQEKSDPQNWWCISTELNPADLTTKPTEVKQLGINSVWQRGPEFLKLPMSKWPIYKRTEKSLPEVINLEVDITRTPPIVGLDVIDGKKFNNLSVLLKTTVIIMKIVKGKSFKISRQIHTKDIEDAELKWIKQVQIPLQENWKSKFKRLGPIMKDEIIYVGSRISNWLKQNWDRKEFILLSSKHRFTKLVIQNVHNIDHGGVENTLAKLQNKFWVPGARKIIRDVKLKCITCRRINKINEGQKMGEVSPDQLNPSPTFYTTSVDLFGPYIIRDSVKKRSRSKTFGVIFTCLVSRAVYLDLAEGYSTEDFLKVLKRFVSIRGYPRKLISDHGTQLVASQKELVDIAKGWDINQISTFGKYKGMEWVFTKSADAPWQNASAESLIKTVKRCLAVAIGDSVLSFSELQTALFEVANLVNERPIGMKPGQDITLGHYLSPNSLLLGRTNNEAARGLLNENSGHLQRLKFINKIVDGFWKKWHRDFFQTLIVCQKWHIEKRNLKIGDIVLIQDNNAIRGNWRLGQVVEIKDSRDNRVRNVCVRYKPQQAGKIYKGQSDLIVHRSVHKLVVILPIEEQ